ncbi:HNH endonuclease [Teichococcus deserti]|uniref:HNH endonuclease n=1 Tax=Teichococcus deserti TaxID=1817963 RepID=UPI0009FA6ED1|nr:HNH endonuclease [Pseudoroseomonas deserti]
MDLATCTACGVAKPRAGFYRNASKENGLQSECKNCRKARYVRHAYCYPKAPAPCDSRVCGGCRAEFVVAPGGHALCQPCVYQKRAALPNAKDRQRRKAKASYERHKEKVRVAVYARRHAEPGTLCAEKRARADRIAAQTNGTLTKDVIRQIFGAAKDCPYCLARLHWSDKTLDHIIPLKLGGIHGVSNVLVCCRTCNTRKNAKPPDRWLAQIRMDHGEAAFGAAFLILGPAVEAMNAA